MPYKLAVLLCFVLCMFFSSMTEASSQEERESILLKHEITEMTLKNGMKVCLKKTDHEEDRVVFQIFAMKGHSSLSPEDRPSALLAADIAWESGLEDRTGDQLWFDLYDQSIEMDIKIQAFDRLIEGACPTDQLETSLKMMKLFFTEPKFEKEALKTVLQETREALRIRKQVTDKTREIFLSAHTEDWNVLKPLDLSDLDYVNLSKAERLFKQYFSNPQEFTCVIVGDFDLKEAQKLVQTYLESIPPKNVSVPENAKVPSFPSGVMKRELSGCSSYKKTMTRLTFPIKVQLDQNKIEIYNYLCQLLKSHLNQSLADKQELKNTLEVNYEFPFYPRIDDAWLVIQFASSKEEASHFSYQIVSLLKQWIEKGLKNEDLKYLEEIALAEDVDVGENTYCLSLLSNYYRWQWDVAHLYKPKNLNSLKKELMKNSLEEYFTITQYSVIMLHP
jgi:zinc protease